MAEYTPEEVEEMRNMERGPLVVGHKDVQDLSRELLPHIIARADKSDSPAHIASRAHMIAQHWHQQKVKLLALSGDELERAGFVHTKTPTGNEDRVLLADIPNVYPLP